jgi:hypothetical protein
MNVVRGVLNASRKGRALPIGSPEFERKPFVRSG